MVRLAPVEMVSVMLAETISEQEKASVAIYKGFRSFIDLMRCPGAICVNCEASFFFDSRNLVKTPD